MRLRHIRRDEEQAIRERLSKDLLVSIRMVRDGDGEGVAEIEIDSGVYAASILAHVRAAGIHPTAEGWMVDEEHGTAEPRRALPPPWTWYEQGDAHVLRRTPPTSGPSAMHIASAWEDGFNVFSAEDSQRVIAGASLGESVHGSLAGNMAAAERECWQRGLFGNAHKLAQPPKHTIADRIVALIEDHARDTRAERDAYKRELDELRARVGEFVEKMRTP